MKLAVAASGGLGLKCLENLPSFAELVCVFTDNVSTSIIEWCAINNVPVFKGNPRKGKAAIFIDNYKADVLFSINYLFVIEKDLIDWPSQYAFNIHGSLLPKYRGRTPHVWAIINGETKTGFTVHLIDEGCDTGDIVLQKEIEIDAAMTGADVLSIFNEQYPSAIQQVLQMAKDGKIIAKPQDPLQATYFGKRTPEDGLINWNWEAERIYNWVRAQAKPYPGAFSYFGQSKVVIHKVVLQEEPSVMSVSNGMIVSVVNDKPVVKVNDGSLLLDTIDVMPGVIFKPGEYFNAGYSN